MDVFEINKYLESKISELKDLARFETLSEIKYQDKQIPIYKIAFGSQNPEAPTLGFVGGVHGLEKIGSQLCLSLFNVLCERILWDKTLQDLLKEIRIFFIPMVNPVGLLNSTRSNANGVDLMRNSPIEAEVKTPFLLGGQTVSNKFFWYRGNPNEMEPETKALIEGVQSEIKSSKKVITVDFHSGFGFIDRIWFPFAYSKKEFPDLASAVALKNLLDVTYPYHIYKIEPQSKGYSTHGDVWDHLYLSYKSSQPEGVYLPFTLEMGSWNWVKKNPIQLFFAQGFFNPIKPHRYNRTLRRHHLLFEFLLRSIYSNDIWTHLSQQKKNELREQGIEIWRD